MLVGKVDLEQESELFEFLWRIEDKVQIDKTDPLGCSKNAVFEIEL